MQDQGPAFTQLVVVGASAGGVEALSRLVATLPADFPAPLVVAQHLDPSRVSHLGEILGRRSTLPVRTVTDHEALEAGVVYVVPSDRNVEITNHHVSLRKDPTGGPRPSVDLLLGTAARVFGEELYAVILTGTGSDGADGARLVKAAGGTVIIQNPETASFPGMPLSLAPTIVDVVADLEAIGPLLYDLLTGAYSTPTPDSDRGMRTLLEQLRQESGIDFSRYRQPTIQRRLERRMASTGRDTLDDYLHYLQGHPDEYQRLADSFLIKVTDFFRDAELFDDLRDRVLPEVIEDARRGGNELRFWSAGCATGEEPYSLAILLVELLGDEVEDFHIRIFATDVNLAAMEFARRGIYSPASLGALPAGLLQRYFTPIDGGYEIKKLVRRHVVFGQHDLSQRSPFPRIDLLLCRNVLIYFTPELQRRVLQMCAFALRTGGHLILGKSETTSTLAEYFVLEDARLKVYRRQGERMLIVPSQIRDVAPRLRPSPTPLTPTPLRGAYASQRVTPPLPGPRPPSEPAERVLTDLPVGVVVVSRSYDVQAINTVARRLLAVHTAAIGEDFIHLARQLESERLRAAVDRAFQRQPAVERFAVKSLDVALGENRQLEVSCFPQQTERSGEAIDRVVVIVSAMTPPIQDQAAQQARETGAREQLAQLAEQLQALVTTIATPAEAAADLSTARDAVELAIAELERLAGLVTDLYAERRDLLVANEDLTMDNARQRSHNEELLVGNEEAQASLEEIETLNEEQQATNEELETLNEELQATIEELNTANDDLEARGLEVQESAAVLEAERSRLVAILASMADAVLVVDRLGQTILTNAAYERLLGAVAVGASLADAAGQPLAPQATPRGRAASGEAFELAFTLTAPDGTRRWFEARGESIQADGEVGGVVVIRDVSERSFLRQQSEFLALVGHELRTPLTAISGQLQLLLRTPATPDENPRLRHYADLGLQQVRLLTGVVGDLTDVVRLQAGRFAVERAPLDLIPLVAAVIELMQVQAEEQILQLAAPREPLVVSGDPHRLQQVVLNLLTNAIKYAPDTERIDVRLRRADGHAELEVQDYGPGIAAADLPNLFARFYQAASAGDRARHGLGLGLYISRQIVEAHGGRLEAQSREGQGATFTMRLPLADAPEA